MKELELSKQTMRADIPEILREIEERCQEGGCKVRITGMSDRTAKQNRMLHASIDDIARQVDWYGRKLKGHEWRMMFSAALDKQDVVPGINGGFVVLGKETKSMSKQRFGDLITLVLEFGDSKDVQWSREDWKSFINAYLNEIGY